VIPPSSKSLGEMLRTAREARGLTQEQVGAAWAQLTNTWRRWQRAAVMAEYVDDLERATGNLSAREREAETGELAGYLDALHSLEPLTTQERDAILCRAGNVPGDLAALILANPDRLDAVRSLLRGTLGPADVFQEEGAGE
jgi:transcriptional regulator with XRE-family HTH domain